LNAGRWEEAVENFRQALSLRPAYAEAEGNVGLAMEAAGRADEAASHFKTALSFARAERNTALIAVLEEKLRARRAGALLPSRETTGP
jgi:Flp pilus assembly protein TadD